MIEKNKGMSVEFTGTASEYFGIWIVNLLLSIVTLGIYSAWAKVRRKKYFYNNTLIDGVGFDYHASPMSILKGRVIAFVLFMAYSLSQEVSPVLPMVFAIGFMLALPWLVVRAMTFNARNSSHRGLRFDFAGSVGEAVKVFIGLPLLIIFTLGLIYPYISLQRTRYLVGNHRFGLTSFRLDAKAKDFYKVYLKALLLTIVAAAAVGLLVALLGQVGMLDYKQLLSSKGVIVAMVMLGYLLMLVTFAAFLQARLGNLTWNSATLDSLSFQSTLRARDMVWLYLSNLVAIICSFGLLTPWAHIRMMRYRTANLAVLGETDLDRFVGNKKTDAKAMGEEMAEMFDVDLAFG